MTYRHVGSGIDDLLQDEGVLEAFQARAIKEVIAWQLAEAMKQRNISEAKLVALHRRGAGGSGARSDNGNVTLETLQWVAGTDGRP